MAENPLDPSPEHEARVRERAYYLWLADGRPEGRDADYWERARELEAMAEGGGTLPNPAASGEPPPPFEGVVDEAQLMENLGEFPGMLTDQGDRQPAPAPKRRSGRQRKT
jgi:hypothetical protein